MRGQISAEMLIVLAVVLAVAVFLAVQLTGMTQKFGEKVNQTTGVINCQTAKLIEGSYCFDVKDCGDGDTNIWKCEDEDGDGDKECILKGPCSG